MVTVQEYLSTSTGTEGSLLIMKKIYDRLIEAVDKRRIGRNDIAIYMGPKDIPGSSVDIDLATPDSISVRQIAEGGANPIDVESYTSFNMKPVKYGARPFITKEMMEDGKWNLLAKNIRSVGIKLGENEDTLIVNDALDNASNTVTGGAAITIANITRGMQYLDDADYTPTTMYVGPEVLNDLRNIDTFVEADKLGSTEMLDTGVVGKIFGLIVKRISGKLMNTKYAYIFDREEAFVMAEKRPVTVENYKDVIHDLSGASITQRIKVRQLRAEAICKITTT